jgi:hypothetical protein
VVEYHSWNTWQGIQWPSRFSVRDSSTSLAVDFRLERIQFRDQVPRDRLRIVIPEDAERFTFESLRRALELAEDS